MFRLLFLVFSLYFYANANTYKDMFNDEIKVEKVNKIYASSPVLLYSLYAIDRSKIAGLNFEFNEIEAEFIDEDIKNLPVIGGWFGKGRTPNSEMILKVNPDVILLSEISRDLNKEKIKSYLGNQDIPLFYLKSNSLEEIVESFSYIGEISSNQERAKTLQNYGKESLQIAKDIEAKVVNKPRVYYAQGNNGLQTECHTSIHAELINLSSAFNVHQCESTNSFGKQTINFEQVLNYNPEIILVYEKAFYESIYKDKKWQFIDAVKNKRVYFLPKGPFSWFDRPPSFMKLLGLKYLLSIFHPELYTIDINKEAKEFYKLFLNIDLTDEKLNQIMGKDIE